MPQTAPSGYTTLQIRLHWVTAGIVLAQLLLSRGMVSAWDVAVDTGAFVLSGPVLVHFTGGTIILALAFWRLMLRQELGAPAPDPAEPPVLARIARLVHGAFYGLLILLPVTGGLAWGMQSPSLSLTHEVLRAILIALILAHVAGALYHRFGLKSGVLARMLRPGGDAS